jgi:hypothetical protein
MIKKYKRIGLREREREREREGMNGESKDVKTGQ